MVEKIVVCRQCKKEFEIKSVNPRFPRRYCDACSKLRKKWWDERHLVKYEDCEDD